MPTKKATTQSSVKALVHIRCVTYVVYILLAFLTVLPAHGATKAKTKSASGFTPQNTQIGNGGFIIDEDTSEVIEDDSEAVQFQTGPQSGGEAVSGGTSAPQYNSPPNSTPHPRPNTAPTAGRYVGQQAISTFQRLAGGDRAVQISGCGGNVTFGASSGRCSKLVFSEKFQPFLMNHIPNCVNEALRSEGLPAAAHIHVQNMGSFAYRAARGSRALSMHATGRSLDVSGFHLTLANGQKVNVPMTGASRNRKFYNSFVQCWRKTIRANAPGCGRSQIAGALDCRHANHHDHVHISLPFCPARAGIISN